MMIMESLFASLLGAIFGDFLFGDPSNKYHPVAWLGKLILFFIPKLKDSHSARKERSKGVVFTAALIIIFSLVIHFAAILIFYLLGVVGIIIFSTLILKITIAIKEMEKHTNRIVAALKINNLEDARYHLSMIVRRNTKNLDEKHIISAAIECISESTVDGIVSPIFYYSFFGPSGAFIYRIINTLDSMIAYKDSYYENIGWMSARLDTIANYIPARIAAILMIFAAKIIGVDWKNSLHILCRDHDKTFSTNAGYPMATMAGALRIRLEKIGHYSLGIDYELASIGKCRTAISIMKLTTILFCLVFTIPLIVILDLTGWWRLLFGL
jgi:adenosylcobinamide-phosphate synthase